MGYVLGCRSNAKLEHDRTEYKAIVRVINESATADKWHVGVYARMKHVLKSDQDEPTSFNPEIERRAHDHRYVRELARAVPSVSREVKDGYSTSGMTHTTSLGRVMTAVEDEPERDGDNEGPST